MELTREELFQKVELAGQDRFCPSASVLMEKEQGPELRKHLELCAWCRSRLEDPEILAGELAMEKLADMLNEDILAQPAPEQVRPGQVWQLSQTHGGWGAYNCYYHAPQVLVRDVLPYGVARVAHVSTFGGLKHQGDISLTDDPAGSFAEFWNVYSVPVSWLDVYVGKVKSGLIAVGNLLFHTQQDQKGPETGSPIDVFRQQELFHSMHFAMNAMDEVMALAEAWEEERQCQEKNGATYPVSLAELDGWSPVLAVPECNTLYTVAAAASFLTLEFGEGDGRNVCRVEYDDGQLSYTFDYIPSHTTFAVVLLLDGTAVFVRDGQGRESDRVLIDSDAPETRRCDLDKQSFERCRLHVFQKINVTR